MRIHIVGVSGTGMGSLAGFLAQRGHVVSGSDLAFNPPIGPRLAEWGVLTCQGYAASHVPADADLVVIGNVCRADNVEAQRALSLGLKRTHIAGALQQFALAGTTPLVVAGTHGKTTTSSLCAWLLHCAGQQPGFFIGGIPLNFGQGFRAASDIPGAPFVVEGDEYDTAFFEKTPKFLHYGATHAIVTSVEHDHVDIYPTEASYQAAFAAFLAQLPAHGVLLANAGDARLRLLVPQHARCRVEWYLAAPLDASASDKVPSVNTQPLWSIAQHVVLGERQSFDICRNGETLGTATLPLSGLHNVANALAAFAVCVSAYGCDAAALFFGLSQFRGSARRQQLLGSPAGVHVYDDFAHHPSAVKTTLNGLRAQSVHGRLAAVFEARSATACRKRHQEAYGAAFDAADLVLLAPIGRPEIPEAERLDLEAVRQEIERRGRRAFLCADSDAILQQLLAWAQPGDSIALLSNGTLGGLTPKLLQALADRA